MAAMPSLKIEYQSPYKGGTKRWSNRYYLTAGKPTTDARWLQLAQNYRDQLKTIITSAHTIVGAVGYDAGSDVPIWSTTFSTAGTYSAGSQTQPPLECCAICKFTTSQRSTKNHPIYLFKYVHGVILRTTADKEQLDSGWKASFQAIMDFFISGVSDGAVSHSIAGPRGAVALTAIVNDHATHRDFPN